MHYVKHFNINGVDTKQVACIELQGKPNAATEGAVGVLGVDMTSPTHEVYKCVAVKGSIYTWELLASGTSIISASISGSGKASVNFFYENLRTLTTRTVQIGDVIIDAGGYFYLVESLGSTYCVATYSGVQAGDSDLSNFYNKDEINAMFGSYVNDIANLIGGEALD